MIPPPVWDEQALNAEREQAIENFREQRLAEPLSVYSDEFEYCRGVFENLLEHLIDLSDMSIISRQMLVDILSQRDMPDAFRHLAGPPISEDDLKTLAEIKSLSSTAIRKSPEIAESIFAVTVRNQLDRGRFPWVIDERVPTEKERHAAIVASAALWATQRTKTARRQGSKQLEEAVMLSLKSIGFTKVDRRPIETQEKAPKRGEFCGESHLGSRKADVIVGLWDGRILAIECKESNSSTNSIKRLNNDAAAKATKWKSDFGNLNVIPAAVLAGVFSLHNLIDAQSDKLTLWWGHDLQRMLDWIEQTKS